MRVAGEDDEDAEEDLLQAEVEDDFEYEETSKLYKQKSGRVLAISQEMHYRYRGKDLRLLSPYAYVALIEIQPKKKVRPQKEGSKLQNAKFPFHPDHPCQGELIQVLRSHVHLPILAGAPRPHPPGPRPTSTRAAFVRWQVQATKWAHYFISNFFAWDCETGKTPIWSYDELCNTFVQASSEEQAEWTSAQGEAMFNHTGTCCSGDGEEEEEGCVSAPAGATWYDRARCDLIEHIATGMMHSSKAKNLLAKFRNRFAERLDVPFGDSTEREDEEEKESGYAVIQAIIENMRARAEADNASMTSAELKQRAYLNALSAAFQVPDEYIGRGAGAGCIEVFGSHMTMSECAELLAEKKKDDVDVVPDSQPPTGARREFDEDRFKATNPFYLKLADAPEQQAAILEMFRTASRGEYLRVLVHGGPGTGKTFFMAVLQDALEAIVKFQVMAPSGVAAAIHATGQLFLLCMYVYVCVCMCMYFHMCVCMYVYVYVYVGLVSFNGKHL